jgi:hypothetical protein
MPGDLVAVIESHTDVTALIGDRIFPLVCPSSTFANPQDRRPCIVYRTSSAIRGKTFCSTDGLVQEFFTFDCYALTYDVAKALSEALIAALVDYSAVSGSTRVEAVFLENEFDLLDMEPGLYRRNLSFTVWHRSS